MSSQISQRKSAQQDDHHPAARTVLVILGLETDQPQIVDAAMIN